MMYIRVSQFRVIFKEKKTDIKRERIRNRGMYHFLAVVNPDRSDPLMMSSAEQTLLRISMTRNIETELRILGNVGALLLRKLIL